VVVELSGVSLHVTARDPTSWEAGPASRREQAAKQAALAAAELSKLSSRLALDSGGRGAAGGAGGPSLRWFLLDLLLSWLFNRLRFELTDVHVSFTSPDDPTKEYSAFGMQLASLATIQQPDAAAAKLAPFTGEGWQPALDHLPSSCTPPADAHSRGRTPAARGSSCMSSRCTHPALPGLQAVKWRVSPPPKSCASCPWRAGPSTGAPGPPPLLLRAKARPTTAAAVAAAAWTRTPWLPATTSSRPWMPSCALLCATLGPARRRPVLRSRC
jgi:hypothetical protein